MARIKKPQLRRLRLRPNEREKQTNFWQMTMEKYIANVFSIDLAPTSWGVYEH